MVPVGKIVAGTGDAEVSTVVDPRPVLEATADVAVGDPVISAVPFAVAEALREPVALPVDESAVPVLIAEAVPFLVAVPVSIGLEDPVPVLVGNISVPLPAVVVVAATLSVDTVPLTLPVALKVGVLPTPDRVGDPKMLERMLPRPVESAVDEAEGVGDVRIPVEGPVSPLVRLPTTEERKLEESGVAVVEAAVEDSVGSNRPLMIEASGFSVAEISAAVVVTEALPEEESTVEVCGVKSLESPDRTLPRPRKSNPLEAVVEVSDLPVGLAAELADITTPPGAIVIPLPVGLEAGDDVVPELPSDRPLVGSTTRGGIKPVDPTDSSVNVALVTGGVPNPTTVVIETTTVTMPSLLGAGDEPGDGSSPPGSLVSPNRSDSDRFIDGEWNEKKSWDVSFGLEEVEVMVEFT